MMCGLLPAADPGRSSQGSRSLRVQRRLRLQLSDCDTLIHFTSTNFNTRSEPRGRRAPQRPRQQLLHQKLGVNATNAQTYSPAASTPPETVRLRSSPCRELSEVLERCCTWVEHPFSLELCRSFKWMVFSCDCCCWLLFDFIFFFFFFFLKRKTASESSAARSPGEANQGALVFLRRVRLSVRQSAPPRLSLRSWRSRCLQTRHRTGWGTTALRKLPYSNLQARPPPTAPPALLAAPLPLQGVSQ